MTFDTVCPNPLVRNKLRKGRCKMATTSMWVIKERIDHVISYTTNKEKTKNNNYNSNQYGDLNRLLNYTTNKDKTEKQFYVTGINCTPENAQEKMNATKRFYNKTDGRLAYHGYQSFSSGEVTAKQTHEIGVKIAEEIWGDRFEVVVSTHLLLLLVQNISYKDYNTKIFSLDES